MIFNHKNLGNKSIKTFPIGAWNVWMCDMLLERSFQRLQLFSWKLICGNYELVKSWDSQFDKFLKKIETLFQNLNFLDILYCLVDSHTIYCKEENGDFLANLNYGVSCELVCLWFVSPLFWFQFALYAFFFYLHILTSPWIFAYEFVFSLSQSFHPPYFCWEMHLGCVTKLKFSSLFFTFDIIEQTYRWSI